MLDKASHVLSQINSMSSRFDPRNKGDHVMVKCAVKNNNKYLYYRKLSKRGIEKWKTIPDFPHYSVSNLGRVRSKTRLITYIDGRKTLHKGKILSPGRNKKDGYKFVQLWSDNKASMRYIHRLVLKVFKRKSNKEVRHLDGNTDNNKLYNLNYGTKRQNEADKLLHGTRKRGVDAPDDKLNTVQIAYIREKKKWKRGDAIKIARRFKVSASTISRVRSGKRYG